VLRLEVVGGNVDEWRDVARRLRGATLELHGRSDGVVLLDAPAGAVEPLLAAGKHVLLADESALSVEALAAWSALVRPGGPQLAVLNRDRFLPSRRLVHDQRDRLGEPGLVRLHRWAAALAPEHLLRDLDSVLGLVGHPPDVVQASGSPGDLLQVCLGFPGGAMALIDHAAGRHLADYSSLCVIASTGAAYADDHANQQTLFASGRALAVRADEGVLALAAMVQAFVDDLASGVTPSAPLSPWRRVLAVRDAVMNARRTTSPTSAPGG